jgi:hypothetical protein
MRFSKVTMLWVSAVAFALFYLAAPSATAQTYTVTLDGGNAGCNSGTGTLIVSGITLELIAPNCYFGTVGHDSGASTCTSANCTGAGDFINTTTAGSYTFQNTTSPYGNAGACDTAGCSVDAQNENFVLGIPSGGIGGSANTTIALGATGNTPVTVDFDKAVLTPEPGSYLLFGSGLLGLGAIFRKKIGLARAA